MRAIVLAYHDIGCRGLEALSQHGFEIASVFTHQDDPAETVWFDSVAETAATLGIPVHAPEDINHPIWVEAIRELEPDILFSFYYRHLIRGTLLRIPPLGCLNLHGSLLPRYRGRSPVNWAVLNGEKQTGVTLHHMALQADSGDIVGQRAVAFADHHSAHSVMNKVTLASTKLLDELLPVIKKGKAPRYPQNHTQASYCGQRTPSDGEIDWSLPANAVRNLVRAVSRPYPGAFTHCGSNKLFIWTATEIPRPTASPPGTILSMEPLEIACGEGGLRVEFGQASDGVYTTGHQLARQASLVNGLRLGPCIRAETERKRRKRILILGVNGFIGNALVERILEDGRYDVHGMDLTSDKLSPQLKRPGFEFFEGDLAIHREWIEYQVKKCDVVVPLVAIATPIQYLRNPIGVFELDFEENLRVVRYCVKYGKRLLFPSTSEVYGMCREDEFNEDTSEIILGPINRQRWIYSCSKQLLDRVIWAYGQESGLRFTLFRPFNWIGPKLDSLDAARVGSSRALTQLIVNLVDGSPIKLVDGGEQRRCFTDVFEGVDCLFRLIEDKDDVCDRQIVNIGNPRNEASIKELAEFVVAEFESHPLRPLFPPFAGYQEVPSGSYYGDGYQDVEHRRPSIRNAHRLVGWAPEVGLEESVAKTLDHFLRATAQAGEEAVSE